ncbi:hypothetical protein EOA22_33345 [Mesorhizobium sp. M7A.F.Ca.US.014.04.1.1]|uniref:hypothetical protein n=1 Tax=Mesorhizobium TaxID=68287 RepID=UPI000FCBB2B9|nr:MULTISPECIES: hypothetical protein [Mesorhizobium]RUZ90445.1 hypothetical protein EN947_06420 [Mesorhizobium sp. M7A.F.Ca.US.003.02.2.1]RVA30449.1 hypothetical protein EN933_33995 [Mesorhizobium sp. M7A.F.Ca.US.001.01.1.1]MBZ9722166.1 hypothetical protein [Mesorhizobium sp. AD1-1]MDF3208009.1 hypothetical protein [Mesorhizobium sp. LMG15046]MDF3229419.1 hypothetical protein [Mesorhizobium sp. DSM 30133]
MSSDPSGFASPPAIKPVRRVVAATIAGNRSNSLLWIGELVKVCVLARASAIKKMKNNQAGRLGAIKGV